MRSIEEIIEIPIRSDVFVRNIEEKIKNFKADKFSGLLEVSPFIQWDNVKLIGDSLLIEKSAKTLEKSSRYAGISGE